MRRRFEFVVLVLLLVMAPNKISAQDESDLAKKALEDTTFTWKSLGSEEVQIYYQAGSFAEKHRAMLLRSASTAFQEALNCLGEPDCDRSIRVFYLDSRDEMNRIVGRPYSGFANWSASSVFVVFTPEWRSFETHEITHVLTMELWGTPHAASRWMIEGISVHCDGWCREYAVDEIAFYFLSRGELPPLKECFDSFASLGEIRGGFYAASVIGFIRRAYGAEALRELWVRGHGSIPEVLGVDAGKIEVMWKDYLKSNVREGVQIDLEAIKEFGCG
jgi:hypothetical protein